MLQELGKGWGFLCNSFCGWVSGKELVMTFERSSGFGSAFCRVCGPPAPDTDRGQTMYAVPVGLLDDDRPLGFGDHIYVGSKANWDVIGGDAPQFDEDGPPLPRDQGESDSGRG